MKTTITKTPVQPAHVPKTVTIVLETLEEEVGFAHLIMCHNGTCDHKEEADAVALKIRKRLMLLL